MKSEDLANSLFIFIIDYIFIMTSKEKSKFRASSKWKKFRIFKKKEQNNLDYISQRTLPKGANLHHLDEKHYDDLSPEKFVFLGKTMHKVVHFLYIYYKKDHTIINRLKEVLDRMEKYDLQN